ncbi:MAG: PQQ-binding-like beta-propeller repeat protein [Bacteroidota bacterium]
MKKILLGLVVLVAGAFIWLNHQITRSSKETITADLDTKTLFDTRCGVCHNGGSLEAPLVSALKLMPEERILAAMKTGIMKNQAASLSDEQHQQLAAYLSEVDDGAETNEVVKGLCADDVDMVETTVSPKIDTWGMGYENQRYYDEKDLGITAENVSNLALDWVFAFPNASRARVQPTIAGNTLFTASQLGTIYALDRHTGCIRWTFQVDAEVRSALVIGRDSMNNANRLYFSDFNAYVYAVDLTNQKLLWKVKIDDHPNATITGTLSLFEDRLFIPVSSTEILEAADENYPCCTFRGSLVALNKVDGSMLWKTYTIQDEPTKQGENSEGAAKIGPSGAPIWTGVTVDSVRRTVYVGTGENYTRPTTKTSDAIMAFSMEDGAVRWVTQTLPDDAWNGACVTLLSRANCPENNGPDADYGAPPILVNHNGKDMILAGQKSGQVTAMDPDNGGKIIWKQQVGRGGTMGGVHWGMATDEETLFVPINDRGLYDINGDIPKAPGMHALRVSDGKKLWATIEEDRCPGFTLRGCGPGISAAITLTPEVVFGPALDGILKAYATDDGRELWAFDAKRDYESVNGVRAFGGAFDSDGPVIVENQLFVTSGYAKFAEKEGNVLLAFKVEE